MKTRVFVSVVLLAMLFCSLSPISQAAVSGPVQKLGRGLTHVVIAPAQIPKWMLQTAYETEPFYMASWSGVTMGGGKGIYMCGRQMVSGLWDMFTFPSPAGRNWEPLFESSSLFPEL